MPENKVISEPVAIGAARRYLRNEQAAQKRAALSRQVTTPKGRPRETFRAFCRREGLPYSSVYKHYRSLKETGSPAVSPLSKGRPRCLTDAEDTALVAYIVELEKAGVFASIPMIVAGANKLRAMRRPPAPPVNKNWFTRWKKDHGELRTTATDPMEVSRLSWEAQSEETSAWYRRANEMAVAQEITASACWNADEMGARLGCRDGRIKVVIVAKKRHKKPTTLDPANRESCTIVGAGNAEGETIPALCIFKQWPTTDWADSGLPGETTFVRSDTGFSNLEIMLTWIRHFNRCSWPLTAGVRRRGLPSIEDWFGYPADRQFDFLMDRFDQDYLDSGMVRSDGYERIWRWLILDGFTRHLSIEIVDYCLRFDIQLVTLPSHSTHRMQPMDVGVFSHFKREQQTVLWEAVQSGEVSFSRTDFVFSLKRCLEAAFTRGHIISGFEDSGIWPLNEQRALGNLGHQFKDTDVARAPLALPKDTRIETAKYVAERLRTKYHSLHYLLSSPTRHGIPDLCSTANEAILMRDRLGQEVRDRHEKIRRRQEKRVKSIVKSADKQFATAITLNDLLAKRDEIQVEEARKEKWKQHQIAVKAVKAEKKAHRAAWQAARYRHEGVRVSFDVYLERVGWQEAYVALDASQRTWRQEHEETPLWAVDNEGRPFKRPLREAQIPKSDDTVDILTNPVAFLNRACPSPFNNDESDVPSSPSLPPSSPQLPVRRAQSRPATPPSPSPAGGYGPAYIDHPFMRGE
ncbi:hypothetical protein RB597_005852 [Gaeumannomyces tritici]